MILTQNVSKTTSVGDGRTLSSDTFFPPPVRRQQQVLGLAACVATSWWAALEDDADERGRGAGLGACESMRGSQKMTNKWHVRKGGRTGRSG